MMKALNETGQDAQLLKSRDTLWRGAIAPAARSHPCRLHAALVRGGRPPFRDPECTSLRPHAAVGRRVLREACASSVAHPPLGAL